jgi:rhodanese-related sulfurtransferase
MNFFLRVPFLGILVSGLTVAAYSQYSSVQGVDSSKPGIMNDMTLRGIATTAPVPTYPSTSVAKKVTGVAVAAILLDRSGHLQSLNVLQAPDDAIGQSVHEALTRWVFRPIGVPMKGKLFFYFTIKKGSGSVSSPAEMNPAIGHHEDSGAKQSEDTVNQIKEAQLEGMRKAGKPSMLDIRERPAFEKGHRDGAVNIPLDEVYPRASIELSLHVPVVVDCYPDQSPSFCRMAAQILSYSGFDSVSVLTR